MWRGRDFVRLQQVRHSRNQRLGLSSQRRIQFALITVLISRDTSSTSLTRATTQSFLLLSLPVCSSYCSPDGDPPVDIQITVFTLPILV